MKNAILALSTRLAGPQQRDRALRRRRDHAAEPAQKRAGRWPLIRCCGVLLHGESHGNAIIEVALLLPIMFGFFVGTCAFVMAFGYQTTLTSAVGAGGQYLQLLRGSTSTDPCADTLTTIQNAAPTLTPGNIKLAITINGVSFPASGTPTANLSCSGDQSDLTSGQPVTVTATYPCAPPIYGSKFSAGCALTAKVTEYEY